MTHPAVTFVIWEDHIIGSPHLPDDVPVSRRFTPVVVAASLATFVMAGYLLVIGRDVLIPIAIAILLWQMINAIAARYRRIGLGGRELPRWLSFVLSVATIAVAIGLVVDLIIDNVAAVTAAAPVYEANLRILLPKLSGILSLPEQQSLGELIDIDAWIRSLSAAFAAFARSIGVVSLYVGFMLLEQETFGRKIDALFPDATEADSIRQELQQIERRVERYLWIKTLMSIATAGLSYLVLSWVGLNNASFWALLIFMLNYIPVVGSLLGAFFPALLTLLQFGAFEPFLVVAICLSVIQFSLGSVLEPRLMGSSLNLSPVVIVVSLSVWGALWGVAGMFLCVPIMVIVTIVCAHFRGTRRLAILLSARGDLAAES